MEERGILSLKEVMAYLGIGETNARKILKTEKFGLRIGNRLYANKILLDRWLIEKTNEKETIKKRRRRKTA